jgi:NhaP-type Na+/H+ or K+/H+ antiporter
VSVALWSMFVGILLITMMLAGTLLARLPLSSAMIYLAAGFALGPAGLAVITPDPMRYAPALELAAEIAVLISLFSVGLRMGLPLRDRRWWLPVRLAFLSMALTVGLVAVVGVWGLGLSVGAAVLLGAILAPTDPVLASGVQAEPGLDPDRLRFSLAGEGGLNDGTAFPFVMLGLGLLGLHELGAGGWRWWAVDLLWATVGGLAIGAAMGALVGNLVVFLRTRHQAAVGLNEFLSLGLLALAYGAAQLSLASGFLAVFAAGLALQRVKERPRPPRGYAAASPGEPVPQAVAPAAQPLQPSASMTLAVQGFNEQLEKLAELAIVLLVGALLSYEAASIALWWFIPLLFLVLRPLAVAAGTLGEPMTARQRSMISWFGIRGIGSVFYLMFAIRHGVSGPLAQQLITFTLVTVAASIVVHGVSVTPLMQRYGRRKAAPR